MDYVAVCAHVVIGAVHILSLQVTCLLIQLRVCWALFLLLSLRLVVVSLVLARNAYRYDFKCRVHQLALISLSLFGNDHGELLVPLLAVLTTQDLGVGFSTTSQ